MNREKIALIIHNHQPVGNFEFVMEENYTQAYLPFLKVLEDSPEIKCHFHFSGPLIDYLLINHPELFDLLRRLIKRGQIRMIGGAYYEPVLAIIPETHRKQQINKMNEFLMDKLNTKPKGIWLAERIWEDNIISSIEENGINYALLDEEHFEIAGIKNPDGAYLTENNGKKMILFPIDKDLRYYIPAKKPIEIIKNIKKRAEKKNLFIIADDGEKFGAWPGSNELVYKKGWLKDFFDLIIQNEMETVFLDDYIDENEVKGPYYFPPSSYEAMNDWALDTEKQFKKEYWKELLEDKEIINNLKIGYFKNFLIKYPESG